MTAGRSRQAAPRTCREAETLAGEQKSHGTGFRIHDLHLGQYGAVPLQYRAGSARQHWTNRRWSAAAVRRDYYRRRYFWLRRRGTPVRYRHNPEPPHSGARSRSVRVAGARPESAIHGRRAGLPSALGQSSGAQLYRAYVCDRRTIAGVGLLVAGAAGWGIGELAGGGERRAARALF